MYHLRLKGTHYEMGVKRGKIFKKCNIIFPLNLDEFQMKRGLESEKILNKYFPEVCSEVKGITDTIGNDYSTFMSWMLAMGCCMYNIENNHPVEIRGCTAFAIKKDKEIYYGRNNDLPPYLKDGSKSEIYNPIPGNKFNITTSSFINGEEGVNEKGLVVAMTFVLTKLKDIKPGFNSVFVVRYLLEKANNTKEAINMLKEIPIASNMNILLADKQGDMVVVECTPNEINIRKPIKLDNGIEVICTVNSFTSNKLKKYESHDEDTYNSTERYNTVIESFKKYNKEDLKLYIEDLLKGKHGFICQYKKEMNFETIWSTIININTLEMKRAEGDPRKSKFKDDNRMSKGNK